MRVLLVEDEPDLGAAIKRTLTQQKYLVDWVMDGTEAWAYLENQWTQYTVAIIDWMLPGMSGVEVCKQLRKNKNPLPVLMLTAKDSMEDKVTGLDAGADDYLVKHAWDGGITGAVAGFAEEESSIPTSTTNGWQSNSRLWQQYGEQSNRYWGKT